MHPSSSICSARSRKFFGLHFQHLSKACFRHGVSGELKFAAVTRRIPYYCMLLKEIVKFLKGGQPVSLEDTLETMAVLDACDRAARSGRTEPVYHWTDSDESKN